MARSFLGEAVAFIRADVKGFMSGMRGVSQSIQQMGTQMTSAARSAGVLGAALSASVVLPLRSAIKTFASVEDTLKQAEIISGSTTEGFKATKDAVVALGAATKFTQQELADSALLLAKAGLSVKQFEPVLKAASDFATATGTDLPVATEQIRLGLNAFRGTLTSSSDETKNATAVADALTRALNSAAVNVTDLGNFMTMTAGTIKALNMEGADAVGTFAVITDQLGNGSVAATAMNMALLQMADASNSSIAPLLEKKLAAIGKTFDDINPQIVTASEAFTNLKAVGLSVGDMSTLLSKRGMRAVLAWNPDKWEEVAGKLGLLEDKTLTGASAAENAERAIRTLAGTMALLESAVEKFKIVFVNTFAKQLDDAYKRVTVFVGQIEKWVEANRTLVPQLVKWTVLVTTGMTAIGTLAFILPAILGLVKAIVIAAIPFGPMLIAVGALVVALRENWDEVKLRVDNFIIGFKAGYQTAVKPAIDRFIKSLGMLKDEFARIGGLIDDEIGDNSGWEKGGNAAARIAAKLADGVSSLVRWVVNSQALERVWNGLKLIIDQIELTILKAQRLLFRLGLELEHINQQGFGKSLADRFDIRMLQWSIKQTEKELKRLSDIREALIFQVQKAEREGNKKTAEFYRKQLEETANQYNDIFTNNLEVQQKKLAELLGKFNISPETEAELDRMQSAIDSKIAEIREDVQSIFDPVEPTKAKKPSQFWMDIKSSVSQASKELRKFLPTMSFVRGESSRQLSSLASGVKTQFFNLFAPLTAGAKFAKVGLQGELKDIVDITKKATQIATQNLFKVVQAIRGISLKNLPLLTSRVETAKASLSALASDLTALGTAAQKGGIRFIGKGTATQDVQAVIVGLQNEASELAENLGQFFQTALNGGMSPEQSKLLLNELVARARNLQKARDDLERRLVGSVPDNTKEKRAAEKAEVEQRIKELAISTGKFFATAVQDVKVLAENLKIDMAEAGVESGQSFAANFLQAIAEMQQSPIWQNLAGVGQRFFDNLMSASGQGASVSSASSVSAAAAFTPGTTSIGPAVTMNVNSRLDASEAGRLLNENIRRFGGFA
jgi:TP901 family phage tail tape measure protein